MPHYTHCSGARFAVKVCFCDNHKIPHPVRRNGKLVYSTPGGGELIPDSDNDIRQTMRQRY